MTASTFFKPLLSAARTARVASAALGIALTLTLSASPRTASADEASVPAPTVVLVHGALADASSWNGVIPRLQAKGYTVIAAANPLRGLKSDSDDIAALVRSVKGPVVLVGHSYGGSVISNAATGNDNVKALVYVAAFAPQAGESAFDLVGKFPGSILGAALATPVALADGGHDLYTRQDKFRAAFAADVPASQAALMAATQRPVTEAALKEASGEPAWKTLPSYFIYGSADLSIPPAAHAFMAQRAGAKKSVIVKGASHVVMISHAAAVANLIEEAVAANVK